MIKWIGSLFSEHPRKTSIPHSKLEKCFTDSIGINYYKFPESMSLPIERFGKLQEFMMWMSAGLTANELDLLLDEADKALTNGLTTGKNAAKIGFVLTQIRERKNMVLHTELLYNFLAVQVVREDEQPEYFNNAIHLEKIDQFKLETANGKTYDFFLRIGLKKLNVLYNMSEGEWNTYWRESLLRQNQLTESAKIISKDVSPKAEPASMSK